MSTSHLAIATPVPALKPPPGEASNFINPPSTRGYAIACFTVCLAVTTILVALRSYTRLFIKRKWLFEDYFCVLGWIMFVLFASFVLNMIHDHGGEHEWDLTKPEVHLALYWSYNAVVMYAWCMLLTKLAILMLYERVFVTRRWSLLDCIIKSFAVVIFLFYIITMFVKIFACSPRAKSWDASLPGTCIPIGKVLNASGIFNVVTDCCMVLIPVKSVWNLKLTTKKKIGVVIIFSIGSCGPVFSIVGLVMRLKYSSSADKTWDQIIIHMWAAAEITTAIICVCSPDIAPLARGQHLKSRYTYGSYARNGSASMRNTPRTVSTGGKFKSGPRVHVTSLDDPSLDDDDVLELNPTSQTHVQSQTARRTSAAASAHGIVVVKEASVTTDARVGARPFYNDGMAPDTKDSASGNSSVGDEEKGFYYSPPRANPNAHGTAGGISVVTTTMIGRSDT